ncbi:MAG: ribosome biogenesis GTP-binding protein YihA/YsxC [Bacteroidia bacterium]|jgi:GTP-binding protein|nr:ribosome biogenesis GTP-binding protein YihA/YsxC [Bacteroidia bacterium]
MDIKQVKFIKSSAALADCPASSLPEFVFTGRSNVGKSSLINMLMQKNELARTSSTPGKTITINHYLVNESWHLVDLPGYGYAKRSKTLRQAWEKALEEYVTKREQLQVVFVLVDSRIPPQSSDISFINNLGEWGVPCAIIFTKSDKNNQSITQKNANAFKKELAEFWEDLPPSFITSAVKKQGRDLLLNYIETCIKESQTNRL